MVDFEEEFKTDQKKMTNSKMVSERIIFLRKLYLLMLVQQVIK